MKGTVLRIEKTSIHDGEGLRTVVFLKGCPLCCKWCSTPESQHMTVEQGTEGCYGTQMEAQEVIREIAKDEVFFFHSGGGVTLSGGEVLCQAEFAKEILSGCMQMGISTAVETSLFASYDRIALLLPYLSSCYADFKLYEEKAHCAYTGVSNQLIKENLKKLDAAFTGELHIRIPMIPSVNMNEDNIKQTALFLRGLSSIKDVEFLAYHRLGVDTYRKLGREYELLNVVPPTYDKLLQTAELFSMYAPTLPVKIKGEPVKNI